MKSYRHPTIGTIDPIPKDSRPRKTWKHFYDPVEYWERIAAVPDGLAAEAESIVGVKRAESPTLPRMDSRAWSLVRAVLDDHHTRFYGPAYMAELAEGATRWAPAATEPMRQCAMTPRGVYVVVDQGEPGRVVTAYRPHPPTSGVNMSEEGLRLYGWSFFRRKTGMRRDDLARQVAEDLAAQPSVIPRSPEELWPLVSAVGYLRALAGRDDLKGALADAERRLAAAPGELAAALSAGLRWTSTLDDLAEALKEEDREDLDTALLTAEELVLVGRALGAETESQRFLAQATELLAWTSVTFADLAQSAGLRAAEFREDAPVRELWSALAAAAAGACVREEAPAVRPVARLVDELLPAPPVWARWLRLIAELPERVGAATASLAETVASGLQVREPAHAMGADEAKEPWVLRAQAQGTHVRVYVVDDEHSAGHAVELAADLDLWRFELPGQQALVVVVAAEGSLPDTLGEALMAAQTRPDVAVSCREVTRPK